MTSTRAALRSDARAWLRRIGVVVLLAGALRASVAAWTFPVTPLGDELYYLETAIRIARGEGHRYGPHAMKARWPPGQAFLLSLAADDSLARENPALLVEMSKSRPDEMQPDHHRFLAPLVALEVALGTAIVALAAALGWLLFGPRAGLAASVLAALHPTLVAMSHYLWSENLFTALLSAGLVALVAGWRRPGVAPALVAGVCFGLAGLTREVGLLVGGAGALWWLAAARPAERRAAALHAALLGAVMALTILPWTLRNARELGRPVGISTVGWMGLREGNTLAADAAFERDWEAVRAFRSRYVAIPDELERMDVARREAFALIREAQPGWLPRKLVLNLGELFGPGSDLLYKLGQGAYGPVPDATTRLLLVASLAFGVLVFTGAVAGVASATGPARWLLPLALLPVVALHVAANAFPKYRVPLLPLAFAYAGLAATLGVRGVAGALTRRAALSAAAVLAAFALACVRFAPEARGIWVNGAPKAAALAAEEPSRPAQSEAAKPPNRTVPARSASEPTPTGPPTRPGRILLLSMDTVRADRVSGYGGAELTPAIARLASEGALFRDFYAASNYTIPSHMSIFTGLDPAEHLVMTNDARLDPAVPTLAELLQAAGYRTRAFHEGGFVSTRFGFARGFEVYRYYPRVEVVRDSLPSVLAWIERHHGEPWFLFLHTYAAHFPYGGFERYRREHPERGLPSDEELRALRERFPQREVLPLSERRKLPKDLRITCTLYNELADRHGSLLPCGGYELDEEFRSSPHFEADLAAIRRSYDQRIVLIDAAVARIRARLEELGQWDDTLFVVTADHGEAFYEHGHARHDYLPFQEVLHVPLVVSYPRWFGDRGGQVVTGAAWHPDLLPTVLALADVPRPDGARGVDLTRVLSGEGALPRNRAVFPAVLRAAHKEPLPMRRVTVRGRLKRVEGHRFYGPEEGFLFDLADDPGERKDLRAARPADVAELEALAREYESGLRPTRPVHQKTGRPISRSGGQAPIELEDETREQLRELGYAE